VTERWFRTRTSTITEMNWKVAEMSAEFFKTETWTAGVVGLGYVGLPLATSVAAVGLNVVGFDVNESYVERLLSGSSPILDVSDAELGAALDSGMSVSSDPADLGKCDAIFICVPSPLGRNREPDLSYIRAAVETIAKAITPMTFVSLESTTYPGTTDDIIVPAMADAGLILDAEVWVAFSPERVDPGSTFKTSNIPKLVGGVSPASTEVALAAYGRFIENLHPVSSASAAEMAKLLENTYRAVNIGLINEMAQLAHELDINIWEVIDAAATKPFGFQAFYPGPGVGGHCIPLDPQFLAWRAREANFATRFIDLAEQVNIAQPGYTARRLIEMLNRSKLPVYGTKILAVGIAYKPNVPDDRESASIDVIRELEARGAEISVMDPEVGAERVATHGFTYITPDDDLSGFSAAIILTDHDAIDLASIAEQVPTVFDARGAYRRRSIVVDNVEVL
jgi:UDP-N-acetyl-D-glucosamine dehydrogenase